MKKAILTSLFVLFWSDPRLCTSYELFAKPVDVNNVRKAAATMVKAETKRAEKLQVRVMQRGEKQTTQKQYVLTDTKEIRGNKGQLLAYVTELEPEGFIITSADDTISPVLGYSFKGKFPFKDSKQNVLLHLVQWDVQARNKVMKSKSNEITSLAQTNNDLWNKYSSDESDFLEALDITQWGPYITTDWHQGGHFNNYCPVDPTSFLGFRCDVGCVATAMGQIMYYWQYPKGIYFNENDRYKSKGTKTEEGRFWIDDTASTLDYPDFEELSLNLSSIGFDGDDDEEAYLSFGIGIKVRMDYSSDDSGAFHSRTKTAYLDELNYSSAQILYVGHDGSWDDCRTIIINNIKKGWPVQLGIIDHDEGWFSGGAHSCIADGYRESDGYFHLNLGWIGGDTWYNLPDFTVILPPADYDAVTDIIYNIYPYQGWNQWGADEKNTQFCVYGIPDDVDEADWDKWHRTTERSRYRFEGMVVGTGNKVYASVSPMDLGQSKSSYIYIIDSYGDKREIELSDAEYGLNYPAQLKDSYIFVTGGEGALYRINPKTVAIQRTLPLPSDYKFEDALKFDEEGNLYATAFRSIGGAVYRLYSFDNQGSARGSNWPFEIPSGSQIVRSPAIDTTRNHVYVPYYNVSTETGYLAKLSRSSGSLEYTRTFSSLPAAYSTGPGTPSVGSDGTIYVGAYTTLYALNPDATLSIKWSKDLYPGIINQPPTIANNHLYVGRWKEVITSWKYVIEARRLDNGDVDWEIPFTLGSYDNLSGQILSGSNNCIIFTIYKPSTNTYTLYCYEDQGTTKNKLWEKEYPYGQAGDVALGPANILYVLGSERITAVSQGERGDPDGLGMAYTDNSSPDMPFNPYPADEANDIDLTITLSWNCSDPEAHTLKYSLFVGESGYDMVPVDTNIASTSYELSGLKPSTGYAWKVIATDGQAVSESQTWVFTTKPPNPDLSGDNFVNFTDFAILASHWLETCSEPDYCGGADYYHDGQVDSDDLSYLSENWLTGSVPPEMVWVYINDPGVSGHERFDGYMSKYETTNAQYCQFLNAALASGDITIDANDVIGANGSNSGADFVGEIYFETYAAESNSQITYSGGNFSVRSRDGYSMANHPVVMVSWYGATAFSNYYGYRLPTDWEWQAVADYDGSFTYGCGTSIDLSKANYGKTNPLGLTSYPYTSPVGYYPAYGYGMCDMAGNVWEWTSTDDSGSRGLRGGCWGDSGGVPVSLRSGDYPYLMARHAGFRVCR
jgi:hypothetical protein